MTENVIKMLNYLKEHPNATREEIEKALDIFPKPIKIYYASTSTIPKMIRRSV